MKYKAFFTDSSIYAIEAVNNMSSAKSFSSYRSWDLRGDLDDVELACDRETEDASYWDIIFANVKSAARFGDFACYERTVTFWKHIIFFLEDERVIHIETEEPGAIQKLREAINAEPLTEEVITFADEDTFVL